MKVQINGIHDTLHWLEELLSHQLVLLEVAKEDGEVVQRDVARNGHNLGDLQWRVQLV